MKNNTLILITIIYLVLSILFNYGLYILLIINKSNDQYFLIFIYFLSEILSFFFFLFPKSKDKIISSTFGPLIINDGSIDISMISNNDNNVTNNLTTTANASETRINSIQQQPFVGMKCISFLIPSIFDFLSKFFIFNGLKMIENEIIYRPIIQLTMILFLSKVVLKSKYIKYNIYGIFVILGGLIGVSFYSQFAKTIKIYIDNEKNEIIGMILCFIGEILSSIQIFFQIKYFSIGEKYCYREIAWEGFYGSIISFLFFQLSLLITCSNNDDDAIIKIFLFCYGDSSINPFNFIINNIKNNIGWNIVFFLITIFYSLIGAVLAKYIGEVYRVGVDVSRIAIFLFLILFIHTDNNSALTSIICGIFMIIILTGIFLSIILRKQKDITFELIPIDKSFSKDLGSMVNKDNSNFNESNINI